MKRFFLPLIIIIILGSAWTQSAQPYPPLSLVSIPTAGTLPRGSFTLETLLTKDGGIVPKLAVGFTDNFSFGVSYGLQNFIGDSEPSTNKPTPEVQIKYRVFDETESMPALVYGLDTQGRGKYYSEIIDTKIETVDSTIALNRYDQKAWGMYIVMSKNWSFLGNLGLHIGLSKNYWENEDGDNDIDIFLGIDKELNRSFSLLLEYDSALNDNEYQFHDLSFGKGKGYLNTGIRWALSPNLMMELNLNNINQNTTAEFTNREVKIMYSESF